MERPLLRNTGYVTQVESVVSNDRRHTVHYLAEITGLGKPAMHRIFKSDLKVTKASARWIPHLLSEDDQDSHNCKLPDVINNS